MQPRAAVEEGIVVVVVLTLRAKAALAQSNLIMLMKPLSTNCISCS
jgi:hypothetical protein